MSPIKSVLMTGAGSGIGAAAAIEFSRHGYFVFLLGRNLEKLQTTARDLSQAKAISCDLADPLQIEQATKEILSHPHGSSLQALVNNAGIFSQHSFLEGTDDLWMQQFITNLMGPIRLTRALWPHFARQKRGSILNVSSTLGIRPTANTGAYSACKAALLNWTESLALEGGPLGIRVNSISPGFVDTPIHSFHHQSPEKKAQTMESLGPLQPLGRIGTPAEIAKAIYFLASDESPWTTGSNLSVDGGISLT